MNKKELQMELDILEGEYYMLDEKMQEIEESPFLTKCIFNSHVQEYECQVTQNGISFDGCLWTELNLLWLQGIKTIGSCCGHHYNSVKNTAYIQVIKEDEQKMIKLGYQPIKNKYGNIIFKPKTIFIDTTRPTESEGENA